MNLIWIPSSPRCPVRRPQRRQSQCLRHRQSRKSRSSRSPHRRQRPRQRSRRRLPEIRRIKRQRRPQRPQQPPPNTRLLKKHAKRALRRASRKWKSVSAGPRRRSQSGRHAASQAGRKGSCREGCRAAGDRGRSRCRGSEAAKAKHLAQARAARGCRRSG